RRANKVWSRLARRELKVLLEPVAANERTRVEQIRRALQDWRSRAFVTRFIEDVDDELAGRKLSRIVGDPREQIIRWVGEACEIAERWCFLGTREMEIQAKGGWFAVQVAQLRDAVRAALGP